ALDAGKENRCGNPANRRIACGRRKNYPHPDGRLAVSAPAPKPVIAGNAAVRYVSTRGRQPAQRFCDVLLGGLASDGGLVVPQVYPRLDADELAALRP